MTRREWLERAALVSVAWSMSTGGAAAQPRSASSALDHLLLGAPDLDAAVAWFEKTTGVRPVIGGSHPGMGTRNALVSLGGRQYLEIIAPDPAQSAYNFHIDVRGLPEPRLVTWAAATPALDDVVSAARSGRSQGVRPGRWLAGASRREDAALALRGRYRRPADGHRRPRAVLHRVGGQARRTRPLIRPAAAV